MSERIEYPGLGWVQLGADSKIVDLELRFTITGRPVVLKNGKRALPTGRRCSHGYFAFWNIVNAAAVKEWMPEAVKQLKRQWPFRQHLPDHLELNASIITYRKTLARADASNLYQAPEDVLQAAGVIKDDYQIRSHDGCDRRLDRKNPRVEITLTPWKDSK